MPQNHSRGCRTDTFLEVVFEELIEAAAVMGVEEEALETVEEKQHRENIRLVNKIMINRVKT